ncbi:MAG: cbb3-type cytochrome c oxidase subunit II [Phycisphaerae bacterium]
MKMTPAFLVVGALAIFWTSVFVAVFLPAMTMPETPQPAYWRPWTDDEAAGHKLYVANGCSYCHSQFIRTVDRDQEAQRIALKDDYVGMEPAILGTERTGPDLSQEGGLHPDDWQIAHFVNPRNTRPMSLMPSWEFLGDDSIRKLTAYVQSLGLKDADYRMDAPGRGQRYWKRLAVEAYDSGPDRNIAWLHSQVPRVWVDMPNPYPATDADVGRGHEVYQEFCIHCHGPVGDGQGQAARWLDPPPLNFTTLKRNLPQAKAPDGRTYSYVGGIFYYQVMNGITGTAMPYFKGELESARIWDVSNYLAVRFVGYTDATLPPRGIPAAYEPQWTNPAATQPASQPATRAAGDGGTR